MGAFRDVLSCDINLNPLRSPLYMSRCFMLQLILENVNTHIETNMWTSDLTLIDWWQLACVDIPVQTSLRAIFQVTRSANETSYGADMAIDDVKLNPGSCSDAKQTAPDYPTSCKQGNCLVKNHFNLLFSQLESLNECERMGFSTIFASLE